MLEITKGDLEVEARGRDERSDSRDPKYYVLLGGNEGSSLILADTLNCDFMLSLEAQHANLERLAHCWNCHDALVSALKDLMVYYHGSDEQQAELQADFSGPGGLLPYTECRRLVFKNAQQALANAMGIDRRARTEGGQW